MRRYRSSPSTRQQTSASGPSTGSSCSASGASPRVRCRRACSTRFARSSSGASTILRADSRSPCGRSRCARAASACRGRRPNGRRAHGLASRLVDPTLDTLVRDAMERYHVPGVAIGMLRADAVEVAAFGVTSVENALPVDGDTLFQIASVTKTMTATVIMRLVERGKLDLDAPVRRYIPSFRLRDAAAQERATIRHLVTHTGGWLGDCFADFGNGDDALERYVAAMAELEQITPLGEIWHYSNSSFTLLGRLIEVVTGKTYEEATRELLFVPLGMTKSCFSANEAITHRVAIGHVIVDEKPTVARPWAFPRATTPVGGIVSTANDLMRYARFHLGDGTAPDGARLLSKESVELMRTPLADADLDRKVGVSWVVRTIGGVLLQDPGGVALGQQGVLMLAPRRREAVTVQTNSARGGA